MPLKPDPTFYPSPKMAMTAPRETLAYVALIDPERRRPEPLEHAVLPLEADGDRDPAPHVELRPYEAVLDEGALAALAGRGFKAVRPTDATAAQHARARSPAL